VGGDDLRHLYALDHLHEPKKVLSLAVKTATHVFQILGHFLASSDTELLNCGVLVRKVGLLCWRGYSEIGLYPACSWFSSKHTQIVVVE
jgi:hypothetical protein